MNLLPSIEFLSPISDCTSLATLDKMHPYGHILMRPYRQYDWLSYTTVVIHGNVKGTLACDLGLEELTSVKMK